MSAPFADDVKDRVRQATDIVDLVGGFLALRRQGRNYVALCPWHDDSRPSLQINPARQSWKCWVCDKGGDVFSFIQEKEGVGFREALQFLADRAGIAVAPQAGPAQVGGPGDKRTLLQAMAWAEKQYHDYLLTAPDAEPARAYLRERRISQDSLVRYQLGASPFDWQWIIGRARGTHYTPAVLEACGILGKSEKGKHYDRFRGRLLFSIRDPQGRPIAFGGRVLPSVAKEEEAKNGRPPAKYINSPETRLYSKSEQLYGLSFARDAISKSRNALVMEGYTDVLIAHQCGLDTAVACCGTALGSRHIRLLQRYCDSVTLVLDGDEAGQKRTNEILDLFVAAQVDLRVMTLPDDLDPADFLLARGAADFRTLLEQAVDALEHRIRTVTRGLDLLNDTHGASRALESILGTLAKAPSTQQDTNRLREQLILGRLARGFNVPEQDLRERVVALRKQAAKTAPKPDAPARVAPASAAPTAPGPRPSAAPPASRPPAPPHLEEPTFAADEPYFDEPLHEVLATASPARPAAPAASDVAAPDGSRRAAPSQPPAPTAPASAPAGPPVSWKDLTPRECELIEILAVHPELTREASGQIEIRELPTLAAQTIYGLYVRLDRDGIQLEFGRVLSELEDPQLKSVLVALDEQAQKKAGQTQEKASSRLAGLARDFRHFRADREMRQRQQAIVSRRASEPEQMDFLQQLIHQKRERQGVSVPTDG